MQSKKIKPQNKAKQAESVNQRRIEREQRKRDVMALLFEGVSFRKIESLTGMNTGGISRIKRSHGYKEFCEARRCNMNNGGNDDFSQPLSSAVRDALSAGESEYELKAKADRFISAVGVGGLNFARMYARCTVGEMAAFLDNVELLHHAAKPRIAVLGLLLKMAHDQNEPGQVRIKAATEWWRLANGESEKSLINIDARTTDAASQQKPDPVMMMLESVKSAVENIDSLDLMSKPNAG